MRKYKIYNSILLLTLFLVNIGCSDLLDESPDERLEVNSLEKISTTLIGSYQNTRGYRFTHFCTDNVTLTKNVFNNDPIIEDLYSWNRSIRNQTHQDSPSSFWVTSYKSIANVNLALESLDKLTISPNMQAQADALKGEALIMRSYCHFMLVNLFSKHYDNSTASTDLGIPYVTKVENKLVVDYERGTVEDVYKKAETDLLEGITLLEKDSKEVNKNKYRFTYPSIYAYASRFYNYRNRDEEDIKQTLAFSTKALNAFGGTGVMRSWSEYGSDNNGPIDIDQQEVGMVQSSYTWISFNWTYQMTNAINSSELSKNPFSKSDERLRGSYKRSGDIYTPTAFFVYVPGKSGQSASDIFPIAEVILNAAEASIRKGDYDKAKVMLNTIGEKVYGSYNPADLTSDKLKTFYKLKNDKEAWTKYLLFERRNMFLMRGLRWFDIKRYGLDVEHILEDGTKVKLSDIAPNKDFQIPIDAINTGMQANQ